MYYADLFFSIDKLSNNGIVYSCQRDGALMRK